MPRQPARPSARSRAAGCCAATVLAGALALLPPGSAGAATGPSYAAPSPGVGSIAARAGGDRAFHAWTTAADWAAGRSRRVVADGEDLLLATPARPRKGRIGGLRFETGSWRSPWQATGFDLTELISSWQARTGRLGWIEVRVRGRDATGRRTSWDSLGRWTEGDGKVKRTSFGRQADDGGSVAVDTWRTSGQVAYQLEVTLARKRGTARPIRISMLGAVASRLASGPTATSAPTTALGVTLEVPAYSQMVHRGHFPQWGGGGQAWCSPTSLAMVLDYYGALPAPASWVPAGHVDGVVDDTARRVFDHRYDGAGNWSFNTAYAASRPGLDAFVTRLADLTQVEQLVAAGIPVVVSVAFGAGQLTGAPITATAGHLMVVVGFTPAGDVVVNDPAAASDAGVRRTYARAQLERAWLAGSGGTAYVVHDAAHPLPASPGTW